MQIVSVKRAQQVVKLTIASCIAVFLALYLWFLKKKRELNIIVDFAKQHQERGAEYDNSHSKERFMLRDKCNRFKTIMNFRDIAAGDAVDVFAERTRLRTANKRRLKPGVIYRSSNLFSGTCSLDEIETIINERGRCVIDLRAQKEKRSDDKLRVAKFSDKDSKGVPYVSAICLTPMMMFLALAEPMMQIRLCLTQHFKGGEDPAVMRLSDEIYAQGHNDLGLRGVYLLMLEYGKKMITRIIRDVANAKEPVILMDTFGKDGVGVICMLIYCALGMEESDLSYTYQMSASLLNADGVMKKNKAGEQATLNQAFSISSPPRVAEDVIEYLRRYYGGPEAYLESIGVDNNVKDKLRAKLLE